MLDTKTWAIRFAFSLALYVTAAWGWKALTHGDAVVFWTALAWIVGLRLWFAVVDAIGDWIASLIHANSAVTDKIVAPKGENQIPRHAAPILAAPHLSIAPSVRASARRRGRGIALVRARIAVASRVPRVGPKS